MGNTLDTPWNRYALIAELARRFANKSNDNKFGKTSLQKIVFLLQELAGLEADYRFSLYTHGPFAAQLLGDLDLVESLGAVKVDYYVVPRAGYGGYEITPGENSELIRDKAKEYIDNSKPAIDRVVEEFGRFSARDLELRSTIIYLDRQETRTGEVSDKCGFIALVKKVKPRFSEDEIAGAIEELEKKGHVEPRGVKSGPLRREMHNFSEVLSSQDPHS